MWKAIVEPVSSSLEITGYAHQVVNGDRTITVRHHQHQNYEYYHTEDLGSGYVRKTGIKPRAPDLTPHPEAVAVANALNAMDLEHKACAGSA